MTKSLIAAIALLLSTSCLAQDYVVTVKGDTLKGEVKLMSYDLLDRLQVIEGKKKTNYTALQVRRVHLKDVDYAPVRLENAVRLMKVIRSGFLSLYYHRAQGQSSYDTKILQKIGGNAMEVPNIGFKKFVGDMTEDCPAVSERVKAGDFDRNHVEEVVDLFNECVSAQSAERFTKKTATPAEDLIEQMKTKVNASSLANKSDANDLLTSIGEKVKKKESVPAYMKDGLKGYLSADESLKADMDQLFKLIDN